MHWVRVWRCRCGQRMLGDAPQAEKVKPKILYFDIESALMTVSTFSLHVRNEYIPSSAIIENSFVICWSACWVDKEAPWQYIISDCVRQADALANNDRVILPELWSLMDQADYIVGHNSNKFDIKKINHRFLMNGLSAPYQAKQLDTLTLARKFFGADGNTLDDWSKRLGYAGKHDMERDDWEKIRSFGDPVSLLKMEMYNRQDVRAGVNVFVDFWNWIESGGRKLVK